MINLSFRADGPGVAPDRWIASLSDGSTVFEDRLPNCPSSWQRLQSYLAEHKLNITCLRLQAYGVLVQLPSHAEGYWHSKQHSAYLLSSGIVQTLSYGIGYITGDNLHIKWVKENGAVEEETRVYNKEKDLAGILNG